MPSAANHGARIIGFIKQIAAMLMELPAEFFPSLRLPKPLYEFSISMLKVLLREAKEKSTIFHFMGTHSLGYHIYALFLRKRRVFATHLWRS